MKIIKFAPDLIPLILNGKKTSTWRLWDDKNLSEGDLVEFVNAETLEVFVIAKLTKVIKKPFKDLKDDEKVGHEKYKNDREMFKKFEKYYNKSVDENTAVKIIWFDLIK